MSLLDIRGLSVRLGTAPVVREVDLVLRPGVWTGLVGANGSGKTTLIRCLTGRLDPQGGEIALNSVACEADPAKRAACIGVSPLLDRLPRGLTPTELLRVLAAAHRAPERDATAEAVHQALALDSLARTPIGAMSSGQRQRVAIRCAFAGAPSVVLLDEPFNWLDPAVSLDLKTALRAAVHDQGLTLLTALHDTASLAVWCDEGLLMAEGRIAARFTGAELKAAQADLAGFETDLVTRLRKVRRALPPTRS